MAVAITKNPEMARTLKEWRTSTKRSRLLLAKELDVSTNAVANWETNQNQPGVDILQRLVALADPPYKEFFVGQVRAKLGIGIDVIQLVHDMGAAVVRQRAAARKNAPRGDVVEIPLVNVEAAAGAGLLNETEEIIGMMTLPRQDVPNPATTKLIRITGESMLPTVPPQTLAAVDGSQRNIERLLGKIVVAFHETEGLAVKRLVRVEGRHRLASDSPGYVPLDVASGWRIVGRLVWWVKSE